MLEDKETVLLDLDGTLLPIDIEDFIERYFKLLTQKFKDIASPPRLKKVLGQATEAMIKNKGKKTSEEDWVLFINW